MDINAKNVVGYFNISYRLSDSDVSQAILIKSNSKENAERFFKKHKPSAIIFGVTEVMDISEDIKKGKPILLDDKYVK